MGIKFHNLAQNLSPYQAFLVFTAYKFTFISRKQLRRPMPFYKAATLRAATQAGFYSLV
jgi:hypothetical protein